MAGPRFSESFWNPFHTVLVVALLIHKIWQKSWKKPSIRLLSEPYIFSVNVTCQFFFFERNVYVGQKIQKVGKEKKLRKYRILNVLLW